jgi:hypothetical protein
LIGLVEEVGKKGVFCNNFLYADVVIDIFEKLDALLLLVLVDIFLDLFELFISHVEYLIIEVDA